MISLNPPYLTKRKKPTKVLTLCFTVVLSIVALSFAIIGYLDSKKNGIMQCACTRLGLITEKEQQALFSILECNNQFTKERLWISLNEMNIPKKDKHFCHMLNTLNITHAFNSNTNKQKQFLLNNLLNSFSVQEAVELIILWSQNCFDKTQHTHIHQDFLLPQISNLNMLHQKNPSQQQYDVAWILGARRNTMVNRIKYHQKHAQKLNNSLEKNIYILVADDRELCPEMDGLNEKQREEMTQEQMQQYQQHGYIISPQESRVEDGKKYILYLAKKHNINLKNDGEFFLHQTQSEKMPSRIMGYQYPNYNNDTHAHNQCIISEATLAQDLAEVYLTPQKKVGIIGSLKSDITNARANTIDTAQQAAYELVKKLMQAGKTQAHLLVYSNNPFIERQQIVCKREINKAIKNLKADINIHVDACGPAYDQVDVHVAFTAVGALMLEKYKNYLENLDYKEEDISTKTNKLAFVTRSKITHNTSSSTPTSQIRNKWLNVLMHNPFKILFSYY